MRVRGRALFQERLAAGVQHGGTERAGGLGKRAPARRLARRLQKRLQHEEAAQEQASGRGAVRGQYYCGSGRAGGRAEEAARSCGGSGKCAPPRWMAQQGQEQLQQEEVVPEWSLPGRIAIQGQ